MVPIIRICSLFVTLAASTLVWSAPVFAAKPEGSEIESYVNARLAEIDSRDGEALKGYLKLQSAAPGSETLADRLYSTAIRAGDMQATVRAVRAQELQGENTNEGPLVLFADAFKRRNWSMATLAATELEKESYFGFMAPILRAWVEVAQRGDYTLAQADTDKEPYFAYYATDQRVYLDIASGNDTAAKVALRAFSMANTPYARHLLIRAAPIYAAKGEGDFASALLGGVVDSDYIEAAVKTKPREPLSSLTPSEGVSTLHVRIAETLLEQKNPEAALVFARLATWLSPENTSAKLILADALTTQDMGVVAATVRQSVPPASPYWPRAIGDAIRQLSADDRHDAAIKLAEGARKVRPRSANMALLLAQAYDNAGKLSESAHVYQQLVDDAEYARAAPEQRAIYRLLLATALDQSGNWPAAKSELEKAVTLSPANPSILNYLGYSLLEKGEDVARGGELITRAHQLSPDSVAITDSLGWAKYLQGQYIEAVSLLERAAKGSGADSTINEHLGDAYWHAGRRIEARYAWRVATAGAEGEAAQRLATKLDVGMMDAVKRP